MTPEVLWSFGRIGNVSVSPDGSKAVYDITYFNKEEDRGYSDLYLMNLPEGQTTVSPIPTTTNRTRDGHRMVNSLLTWPKGSFGK